MLDDGQFFNAFFISIKRVVFGGLLNFALNIMMAYALSKDVKQFPMRNIYMWFLVFTMLFSGGIVPWFMTIKSYGMLDSMWALILPHAVQVFNVILLMNFFRNLPKELSEAAEIDGRRPMVHHAAIIRSTVASGDCHGYIVQHRVPLELILRWPDLNEQAGSLSAANVYPDAGRPA